MKSLVSKFGKASSSWLSDSTSSTSAPSPQATPTPGSAPRSSALTPSPTSDAAPTPSQSAPASTSEPKSFQEKYAGDDWTVRTRDNSYQFQPQDLDGKEIAFQTVDRSTGEVKEHRGKMIASRDHQTSALFRIEGSDQVFNNNYIDDFAVKSGPRPEGAPTGRATVPKAPASEVRSSRLVYTAPGVDATPKPPEVSPEAQAFRSKFGDEGWTVKGEENRNDFDPMRMDGKEVAFQTVDRATGEVTEHQGKMIASRDHRTSALFRIEGSDQVFNNNTIDEMAVNDSFGKTYAKDGWTVKGEGNRNDFAPETLNGKEVAFRTLDRQTNEMVEKRGVLESTGDHRTSALFTLKGSSEQFNNNSITEMAVNDKFERTYANAGWTVRSPDNSDQFAPERLHGQEVVFQAPDAQGEVQQYQGVFQRSENAETPNLFTLEGWDALFQTDSISRMATRAKAAFSQFFSGR